MLSYVLDWFRDKWEWSYVHGRCSITVYKNGLPLPRNELKRLGFIR